MHVRKPVHAPKPRPHALAADTVACHWRAASTAAHTQPVLQRRLVLLRPLDHFLCIVHALLLVHQLQVAVDVHHLLGALGLQAVALLGVNEVVR